MDVQHRAQSVRLGIEGLEPRVSEGDAIHVAEEHGAREAELLDSAPQLDDRSRRIAERERRQRGEARPALPNDRRERVIHELRESHGATRLLDVRSRCRQADDLGVDSFVREHVLAVGDVAVATHRDIVIAGIMHAGISLAVEGDTDDALLVAQGIEIFRRVEMIMDVDDHRTHGRRSQSPLAASGAASRARRTHSW